MRRAMNLISPSTLEPGAAAGFGPNTCSTTDPDGPRPVYGAASRRDGPTAWPRPQAARSPRWRDGGFSGTASHTYTADSGTTARGLPVTVTDDPPEASFSFSPAVRRRGRGGDLRRRGPAMPTGRSKPTGGTSTPTGLTDATGQTASVTFSSAGDRPVTLTVEDNDGETELGDRDGAGQRPAGGHRRQRPDERGAAGHHRRVGQRHRRRRQP